jgi:hypothetical protein
MSFRRFASGGGEVVEREGGAEAGRRQGSLKSPARGRPRRERARVSQQEDSHLLSLQLPNASRHVGKKILRVTHLLS